MVCENSNLQKTKPILMFCNSLKYYLGEIYNFTFVPCL